VRVEPNEGFLQLRQDLTEIAHEICLWTRHEVGLSQGNTRRVAAE
jgi:hypothetical protein